MFFHHVKSAILDATAHCFNVVNCQNSLVMKYRMFLIMMYNNVV